MLRKEMPAVRRILLRGELRRRIEQEVGGLNVDIEDLLNVMIRLHTEWLVIEGEDRSYGSD